MASCEALNFLADASDIAVRGSARLAFGYGLSFFCAAATPAPSANTPVTSTRTNFDSRARAVAMGFLGSIVCRGEAGGAGGDKGSAARPGLARRDPALRCVNRS